MRSLFLKKEYYLVLYYLVLLLIFFVMMKPEVSFSLPVRIVAMAFVFIPVAFHSEILPFSLLCFHGVSSMSFAPILPASSFYYLLVSLLFYIFYKHKSHLLFTALFVLLYFLSISLIYNDSLEYLVYLFISLIMADMIKDKQGLNYIFLAFVLISVFLSVLFLTHTKDFVVQYGDSTIGVERMGWINPNSFSAIIGAGGVLAVAYITKTLDLYPNKVLYYLCIVAALLSTIVIIMNASRGALLALVFPSVLMILRYRGNWFFRLLLVFVCVIFVIWLLNSDFFELLSIRMQEDTLQTGGGRISIWEYKLPLFLTDNNIFHLLFGIGYSGCTALGNNISTHNDFITALIGFGIIGFFISIFTLLVYPVLKTNKKDRWTSVILLFYLLIECLVLEPFFRGYLFVMMFYVFVLKNAMISNYNNITKKNLSVI